jgi:hypothetical protein
MLCPRFYGWVGADVLCKPLRDFNAPGWLHHGAAGPEIRPPTHLFLHTPDVSWDDPVVSPAATILRDLTISLRTPFVPTSGQWIASRIIYGFFGAPVESLNEASIAMLYFSHERGFYIGIYAFVLYFGAFLAPICSVRELRLRAQVSTVTRAFSLMRLGLTAFHGLQPESALLSL